MRVTKEIASLVNNIRYYCKKINEQVKLQFEEDCSIPEINTKSGELRFNALGNISGSTGWIEAYCSNIEASVKAAEAQDAKMTILEEIPIVEEVVQEEVIQENSEQAAF